MDVTTRSSRPLCGSPTVRHTNAYATDRNSTEGVQMRTGRTRITSRLGRLKVLSVITLTLLPIFLLAISAVIFPLQTLMVITFVLTLAGVATYMSKGLDKAGGYLRRSASQPCLSRDRSDAEPEATLQVSHSEATENPIDKCSDCRGGTSGDPPQLVYPRLHVVLECPNDDSVTARLRDTSAAVWSTCPCCSFSRTGTGAGASHTLHAQISGNHISSEALIAAPQILRYPTS